MEQQFSSLNSVMEPETIPKNGASSKSLMSRNFFKQTFFALLNVLAGTFMLFAFTVCVGGNSGSGGKSAKIKMTLEKDKLWFELGGSGTATVDWGDGSEKVTRTLNSNPRFEHSYPSSTIRTILINGDNITGLDCFDYQLTGLDVSKNTELKRLVVAQNQLTSLDVSKNTVLECLVVFRNQLTSLDVSKNTELTRLECGDNQLTSLDVSKNTALKLLTCRGNQFISLDVSKNTALTELDYDYNKVKLIK